MKRIISLIVVICIMSSVFTALTIGAHGAGYVSASTIVRNAESMIDKYPYVWGGESPEEGGFDCSGFVWYVYNKMSGVNISLSQAGRSKSALANAGTKIYGISNFLPGDIVQFEYTHVAIYIGNNTVVEAAGRGTRIRYKKLDSYSQVAYAVRLSAVTQGNTSNNSSGSTVIRGDVNGDGRISITDLSVLRNYLANGYGNVSKGADVNGDGRISIIDMSRLRTILAQ